MEIKIPGLRFIQSSLALDFNTDGEVKTFLPVSSTQDPLESIFIVSDLHYEMLGFQSINEIKSYSSLFLPQDISFPVVFDGTQGIDGKKVLMIMLTGWGDTILIEPALHAFFDQFSCGHRAPEITIAGNWIKNFPYRNSPYIKDLVTNILSLNDLLRFDIIINFIPAHFQRSPKHSLQELYANFLHIKLDNARQKIPVIRPEQKRIERLRPVFDQIRRQNGKKLVCINWLSRFRHKNAPAGLFAEILALLPDYQAVAFNDDANSLIINKEITRMKIPLVNVSGCISDYHDTIAALSLVDAFISVDTGIVHAAGALKIPGVALFGPFPPETHIFCYPTINGVQANFPVGRCTGPCLETHRGCREVDYRNDVFSPCFQSISPHDVLTALQKAMNKNVASENYAGEKTCAY
jgi:ADP-heptose:LPS heptosyltransferase